MSVPQATLNKLHTMSRNKKDGVYSYSGRYYYAVKQGNCVLIGYRFSGEVWAVAGGFLIERQTQLRKDLKKVMQRSI